MSGGRFDRFVRLHASSSPLWLTTALMAGAFMVFALSAAVMVAGAVQLDQAPAVEAVIGSAVFFLIFVLAFAMRRRRQQLGLTS
jgi:hypothetical protein